MNIDSLPRLRTRSRWRRTPWRSVVLEADSTHVVVQTVQHEAVYADLVRTGLHRPPRWGEDHDFAEGYAWMAAQMASRLSTDGDGIVWGWAHGSRRDLRSDVPRDEVLLRCRVPRERVLVSHFSDWHCVLNRMPFLTPLDGEDEEAYGLRVDPMYDAFFDRLDAEGLTRDSTRTWPGDLREQVESSWQAIFDARLWTRRSILQATMHEIRAEDVVQAVRFR